MRWLRALALLSALAQGACTDEASPVVSSIDLLIHGQLSSDGALDLRDRVGCGDESGYALVVGDGAELSVRVDLAEDPSLEISACVTRPLAGEAGGGRISVVAEPADPGGEALRFEAAVPEFTGRFDRALDLVGAAGPTDLHLRLELPEGREVMIWDAAIRHRERIARPREPRPKQVLLISVDTLRADALGGPWETPNLDRFAARSETWSPHYAAAPWTKPSHASLLTGYSPPVHGAEGDGGVLADGVLTLAERFAEAGARTAALTSECTWLSPRFGFAQGFESYRSEHWKVEQSAREVGRWIVEHRDEPFFFFFHSYEVHSDFYRMPYEGRGLGRAAVHEGTGLRFDGCREGRCATDFLKALRYEELEQQTEDAQLLSFLYGAGVERVDRALGSLFDQLEQAGVLDGLLVVLTSDHGESLLEEKGAVLHGTFRDAVLRVPLVVHWPDGRAAGETRTVVSSALDVAPTILHELGMDTAGLPGAVLSSRRGDRPAFSWDEWVSVATEDLQAVIRSELGRPDLLYAIDGAGWVRPEVSAERPEALDRLVRIGADRQALGESLRAQLELRDAPQVTLSEEEQRRLRALGYLSDSD